MELFKPSKKVLEMICSEKDDLTALYEIFPFGENKEMEETRILSEVGLFESIIEFYRKEGIALNEKTRQRLDYQGIHNVIGEVFKNWTDHSPENSNLISGFFFGSKGICYGFQDGGNFFKNKEIKYQIENKINFNDFNKNPRGDCCNSGFNDHIFPCSDFIEVDSEKGILYCVQLKENIIAPEGKNGSEYCHELRKNKINNLP
jgi:hypothetical protein